jgi:excisionase family DNA binding protein
VAETLQFDLNWKPEPQLYSKEQASIFLGVGVRTINRLLRKKELVRRRIGGRVLIPVTSLRAFLTKDHATGYQDDSKKLALDTVSGN